MVSLPSAFFFRDGKAVWKMMDIYVSPWKAKARNWLQWLRLWWLRGLVGW
jgi:hypothetical protein